MASKNLSFEALARGIHPRGSRSRERMCRERWCRGWFVDVGVFLMGIGVRQLRVRKCV